MPRNLKSMSFVADCGPYCLFVNSRGELVHVALTAAEVAKATGKERSTKYQQLLARIAELKS